MHGHACTDGSMDAWTDGRSDTCMDRIINGLRHQLLSADELAECMSNGVFRFAAGSSLICEVTSVSVLHVAF